MKLIKRLLAIIAFLAVICTIAYVLNEKFKAKYVTVSEDADTKPY